METPNDISVATHDMFEELKEDEMATFADRIPGAVYLEKYKIKKIMSIPIQFEKNVFRTVDKVSTNYIDLILNHSFSSEEFLSYWKKFDLKCVALSNEHNLKKSHISALYNYSNEHYKCINEALLKDDPSQMILHSPFIKLLRHAVLSAYQPLPDVVYRKLNLAPVEVESYKKMRNKLVCLPQFVSTTKDRNLLDRWEGNYVLQITLSPKSRTCACDISDYSMYPLEAEVLIIPYTFFHVIDVDEDSKYIFLLCKDHTFTKKHLQSNNCLLQ